MQELSFRNDILPLKDKLFRLEAGEQVTDGVDTSADEQASRKTAADYAA